MNIIQIEEKRIKGISIRTTNANEMNADTAKIANLYQQFDQQIVVDYKNGAHVYGIYFDYESDASGEFSVLAGADEIDSSRVDLQELVIPKGNYLVFKGEGEMPQAVINTWMKIWDYFSNDDAEYERAYTTDFEFYKSESEVDIHIAIKTA